CARVLTPYFYDSTYHYLDVW
nr:immunoglobulin heavy chain junction region [Macaca mulatta]